MYNKSSGPRIGRFLEKIETEIRQEKTEKKPENRFFKTSFLHFSFMRPFGN